MFIECYYLFVPDGLEMDVLLLFEFSHVYFVLILICYILGI